MKSWALSFREWGFLKFHELREAITFSSVRGHYLFTSKISFGEVTCNLRNFVLSVSATYLTTEIQLPSTLTSQSI